MFEPFATKNNEDTKKPGRQIPGFFCWQAVWLQAKQPLKPIFFFFLFGWI